VTLYIHINALYHCTAPAIGWSGSVYASDFGVLFVKFTPTDFMGGIAKHSSKRRRFPAIIPGRQEDVIIEEVSTLPSRDFYC